MRPSPCRRPALLAGRRALLAGVCAFTLAAPVQALAAPAPDPAAAAAKVRTCAPISVDGTRFRVTIERGRVRCSTARRTMRRFFSGRGVRHGGPSNAETYFTLGRWRCGRGAGGAACLRYGTNYRNARDFIMAEVR